MIQVTERKTVPENCPGELFDLLIWAERRRMGWKARGPDRVRPCWPAK